MREVYTTATIGFGIYVAPSMLGPLVGLGAFAARSFAMGEVVTLYDGVAELKMMLPPAASLGSPGTYDHVVSIPGTEWVIWGIRVPHAGLGAGSFCNHSTTPNCRFMKPKHHAPYRYHGQYHDVPLLGVQALKDIGCGDELTVKYGAFTLVRLGIE